MTAAGVDALLAEYPVRVRETVRWGDMDAFGHVNNTVYLRYFEGARIAYFERVGFLGEAGMRAGPILAATDCRFRIPLEYPDTVWTGARVTELGEDRFVMAYRVVSEAHAAVAAEGGGRIVVFNYVDKHKTPIPDAIRRRIEALEGR